MADPLKEGTPMPAPEIVDNRAQATLEAQRVATIRPDDQTEFLAANKDLQKPRPFAALGNRVRGWWSGLIHHPMPSHEAQMKAAKGTAAASLAVVGAGAGIKAAQEVAPIVQNATQSVAKNVNNLKIPNPLGEGGYLSAPTASGASYLDQKPPTYGPMSYEGEYSGPGERRQLEEATGSQQGILESNTTAPPPMNEFSTNDVHDRAAENRKKYGPQYYDPGGNYTSPEDAAASQNITPPKAPTSKPIPYDDPSQNPANVTFEPISDPAVQEAVDNFESSATATAEASAPQTDTAATQGNNPGSPEPESTPSPQGESQTAGTPTVKPTSEGFGGVLETVQAVETNQAATATAQADAPVDPQSVIPATPTPTGGK